MSAYDYLGKVLDVTPDLLRSLDAEMAIRTNRRGVVDFVAERNENIMNSILNILDSKNRSAEHVRGILRQTVFAHEKQFMKFLSMIDGKTEFEKAALLSRKIADVDRGFFLKRDFIERILKESAPEHLLSYLQAQTVDEVLQRVDAVEAFSALRFTESDEWMHQMFERFYSSVTVSDFEERNVEIRVLGPEWYEISKQFVAKKHHNVSHLKEFGVIFLNPIKMDIPGKFLRDFALLLHYFHEIDFYSKLFRQHSTEENFAEVFKALLRGDVNNAQDVQAGEWLIVQRYLFKEDPRDPRLFLPRVNPESLHWMRGERDLTVFGAGDARLDLTMWHNMDWVGGIYQDGKETLVSFDLEDTVMSLVSFMEGREESFYYHQREALWTKLFTEYAGGEQQAEHLLLQNFERGIVRF
ncbi:MAG: hypothetical protein A3F24_00210 [Candidatus Colwellbacteria bacterium RIFCSPHIGHO2_12_FULL_44_17]|uniref:Uncharacterized protein n=1 Tax=Candidatus Colwellbacteria bacterium RIFCSPHIGHO2_12_FULL_44_17 TaxID=1797689 RepID=A0A1G1Z2E6_9BACT|nr:MAG: hypothetical protein A3F24_00210 [Candidatus Colwellbacteria bacterium RIFCSPHIGHO2_12_FULL_44_17]